MISSAGPIDTSYALIDHHGRSVTEHTFAGRYQLIFFGFTHCRSVCPRALTKLSGVVESLGEAATQVQPLYITIDPDRDTPDVMRQFLESQYPRFLGLTGTRDACQAARDAFKVFAQREAERDQAGDYQIPHSALTYILDREGRYLTHFLDIAGGDRIKDRLLTMI